MSATDVVNLVFAVAGQIIRILNGNKEILAEQQEMIATCTTITSSLKGLSVETASNYQAALESMNDSLEHAKELLETIAEKFKKKGLFKFYLSPDAELKKLAACSAKIDSCVSVLTMALSAQLNVNANTEADKKFDATRLMQHSSAKKFWGKHFGSTEHSVPWPRFRDALRMEFRQMPPVLALLTDFNLSLLQHKFGCSTTDSSRDSGHDVQVTAYLFADLTDDYGLVQSLQRLMDPAASQVEKSVGSRSEILAMSLVAEGAMVIDFAEASAVRNAFEQQGACPIHKFTKCASGVLIEYVDGLPVDTVSRLESLYADRDASLRVLFARSISIGAATQTCDEIIENDLKARERLNAKLSGKTAQAASSNSNSAKSAVAEEESEEVKTARVRAQLEMLIMQEETENKADQALSAKEAALQKLESDRRVRLAECAREPNPLRRQQLEHQVEIDMRARRAEVEKQFETSQQEIQSLRDQQSTVFEKKFPGLIGLFSRSQEQRDSLIREQFGSIDPDESVIDSFLCSLHIKDRTLPVTGNLYVTGKGIYFYSNFLGFETRDSMRFVNMQSIEKLDTFYILPTSLRFTSQSDPRGGKKTVLKRELNFSGFVDRDRIYDLIGKVWQNNNNLRGADKDGEVLVSTKRVYFVRDFFVRKSGFMFKLGGVMKNWKRRYFILSDKTLSYSENDQTQDIIEAIPLSQVSRVEIDTNATAQDGRDFVFSVVTPSRRFQIAAETESEREDWVSLIEECRANIQQLFFFGVWCLTENSSENVDWRVLELDFDLQIIRVLNRGLQMLVLPFTKIASASRDVDHELRFSITTEVSNIKYEFFTQCPLARNRVVDIVQRSINKSNRVADQFLAFQQSLAKVTSKQNGGTSDDARAILNEFFSKFDNGDGRPSVEAMLEHIQDDHSNIRDELATEMAARKNLCDGELRYSGKTLTVDRYVILQQSNANGSCDLLIYRDKSAITPLKVVSMTSVNTLPLGEDSFMIQTRFRTKPFVFRCKTAEDRIRWVSALLSATEFSFNAMVRAQVQQRPDYFRQLLNIPAAAAAAPVPAPAPAPVVDNHRTSIQPATVTANVRRDVNKGKGNEEDRKTIDLLTQQLREKEVELERLRAAQEVDLSISAELEAQLQSEIASRERAERALASSKQSFASGLKMFEEQLASASTQTLKSGAVFLKHVKNGAPHARFVYLDDDGRCVCWTEGSERNKRKDAKSITLSEVTDVHKGFCTPVFSGKHAREEISDRCFSLVSPDRSLDLQCDDAFTRDFWVNSLIRMTSAHRLGVAITTNSPSTPVAVVGNLGTAGASNQFSGFGASMTSPFGAVFAGKSPTVTMSALSPSTALQPGATTFFNPNDNSAVNSQSSMAAPSTSEPPMAFYPMKPAGQ